MLEYLSPTTKLAVIAAELVVNETDPEVAAFLKLPAWYNIPLPNIEWYTDDKLQYTIQNKVECIINIGYEKNIIS